MQLHPVAKKIGGKTG